ncbi:MAG: hypothetical protein LQ343_000240 [Gyalolechia ehrenbergii]|nr:MAG: hypothetical protein LQ343_000240 [Gyalolechia ehrenbergii]
MSRLPNGSNGYVNGDHGPDSANPYRDGGPMRPGREYRTGGYGGFDSRNGDLSVPQNYDAAFVNERSIGTNNGHDSSRNRFNDQDHGGWQNTSRSRDRNGFQNASASYGNGPGVRQIEDVLHHINDKWEIMATDECVPVHLALQLMDHSSLGRGRDYQDFQRTSRHLQKALRSIVNGPAKSSLMEAKPELQDLGTSSQKYESMLHVLGQIERLQTMPEILDARIADKKFLAAVDILQDALRMIRKSEMESIGAFLDLTVPFNDETMSDPQTDSFRYIYMLLEALDTLGCLDIAVDRIEQRLPVELFTIVDRTNQEVDLRHPLHLRNMGRLEDALLNHSLSSSKGRSDVLDDLLWTLYSKFEAIAEGHRVVHDVVLGIARRNGLRGQGSLTGSFKELWKLYQSELRSLLHDYLATDESILTRNGRSAPGDSNQLQKNRRDRLMRVFKLAEIDHKSSNFTTEQEDLNKILQNSVPGLVSKSRRQSDTKSSKDRVSKEGPATHKLLIESSVFNIAILLPPSLSFLQRLKDIVPLDSDIAISTLTSFLDDFLVNVFLPQLEETVTELCGQSMSLDAFQQDPLWQQEAARPILKSTSEFFKLITTFSRLFDSLPDDQSFIQPILSQLVSYYDRCRSWYKSMVQRGSTQANGTARLKPAAVMTETGDLRQIMSLQWESKSSDNDPFIKKEVDYLVSKISESPLVPMDIISDRRTVASLCLLYSSMQWLATGLTRIRHLVPESQASKRGSTRPQQMRRWTLLELNRRPSDEEPIRLPMNEEAAATFDGIVVSIRALALDALFTLQVDIRCGIAHMTAQMLKTPYLLSYPTNNPDPSVLSLNSDLLSFDDVLSTYLPSKEHRFVTAGLTALVDTFLVTNASRIQSMNAYGCGRMQLNILVLQQNLKSIEGDVSLSRSAHFFELFAEGADAIVARVKEGGSKDADFTMEERKTLVELCHSEGLQSPQREASVQARRRLTEHLKQLEESM